MSTIPALESGANYILNAKAKNKIASRITLNQRTQLFTKKRINSNIGFSSNIWFPSANVRYKKTTFKKTKWKQRIMPSYAAYTDTETMRTCDGSISSQININ